MMKRKVSAPTVFFLALLLLITSSVPACTPGQKVERFKVNDYSLWSGDELVWASVSVRDSAGKFITGLTLNDFQLTEALISPSGAVLQERAITFDEPDYQFEGDGFWERSVNDEKLDIVFLVDSSGSMEDEMPSIHAELHEFVNRLESQHIDFRLAVMKYDWDVVASSLAESYTSWAKTMPFRGVMESKEIHQWLDKVQLSWGEWWLPAASYDQMMLAGQMDFRQEARKVMVVITDTIALNIYGTEWYPPETTATCLSAVELFFKDKDIEILYSQPDEKEMRHLIGESSIGYVSMNINPKAMAGFKTLGKPISWPFRQEDIKLAGGGVTQSQYFFAWMSRLEVPDPRQDYKVKVTLKTPDPEKPDESLQASFTYVPYEQEARLVMTVTDEEGNPIDEDVSVSLQREMGDRRDYNRPYSQLEPEEGQIVIDDIPVGKYYLHAYAAGDPVYETASLRYAKTGRLNVPAKGLELTLRVETGDRDMELAKARGLLRDLDDWHSPGDPFRGFVQDAEKWLEDIEKNGVTLQEMVAIKRFFVALSGYANLTEYSQMEIARATENFYGIVQDCRNIIEQIKAFHEATELSWEEVLAEIGLDIITLGGATEARATVEKCLEALFDYVESELLPELIEEVMEQIPAGPYKPFLGIIINTCMGAELDSWDSVIETAKTLLLDQVLEEVRQSIAQNFAKTIFSGLKPHTSLEKALVNVVRDAITELLEGSLDNFDRALEKFAQNTGSYVQKEGREQVVTAVTAIMDKVEQKLAPGDARDFLLGMAEDLLLQAIPNMKGTPPKLDYSIDSDAVAKVLVKHGLYYVVLKDYYVDKARDGMMVTLERARSYVPDGETPYDWETDMREWAFSDYRSIMRDLQDYAWDSLEFQEDVRDWYEGLEGLVEILEPLAEALDTLGRVHPAFDDIAAALHAFIAVLDGIKIIPRAIEFGLQIQALDMFGNSIEPLYQTIFTQP